MKFINFSELEKRINGLFLAVLFCYIVLLLVIKIYDLEILDILKLALEASLVGAIADSYAVFGLFHKIGPHTNLLLRKRHELSEKITNFISSFIFDEDVLKSELKRINIDTLIDKLDNHRLSELLINSLGLLIDKYIELVFARMKENIPILLPSVEIFLERLKETLKPAMQLILAQQVPMILNNFLTKIKNEPLIKDNIKENLLSYLEDIIRENHHEIRTIVKKRLEEISDEEFLTVVKRGTWDELQWIRLNGMILGFIVGTFLGLVEFIIRGKLF